MIDPPPRHCRRGIFDRQRAADQIDAQDVGPIFSALVGEVAIPPDTPRIGEEDVEPAVLADDLLDEARTARLVTRVGTLVRAVADVGADDGRAFCSRNSSTLALPMPDAAPVTIATLPSFPSPPHSGGPCGCDSRPAWISASPRPRPSGATRSARSWTRRFARAPRNMTASRREGERWKVLPVVEELKDKARAAGLWNLFMPPSHGATPVDDSFAFDGPGLSNLQYAFCAEEMGRLLWSAEAFNCSAPDTGNMEVLAPLRHARAEGRVAEALDGRRNPLGLPDDRARGRLVRRHQHPVPDRAQGQWLCHQRPQMVVERGRRSALQDRDPDGQDRSRRREAQAAVDDPAAARHAGRDDRAAPAGVRL